MASRVCTGSSTSFFKEDQSRLRKGHGARNMALVRRLAFNMVAPDAENDPSGPLEKPPNGTPLTCP